MNLTPSTPSGMWPLRSLLHKSGSRVTHEDVMDVCSQSASITMLIRCSAASSAKEGLSANQATICQSQGSMTMAICTEVAPCYIRRAAIDLDSRSSKAGRSLPRFPSAGTWLRQASAAATAAPAVHSPSVPPLACTRLCAAARCRMMQRVASREYTAA
jgi:hypothetical protein